MVSITAGTKHSIAKKPPSKKAGPAGPKRGTAPPLKPGTLSNEVLQSILEKNADESSRMQLVRDSFRKTIGEHTELTIATPHTASTTRDRGGAAADLAILTREWGTTYVLKTCEILNDMQRILFPEGIENIFPAAAASSSDENIPGLKPSVSALSLASMDYEETTATSAGSIGTDTKRGKSAPPSAREGVLLFLRALCEIVDRKAEPYIVGAFLVAALDECGSSSSSIREAAQDATQALVNLANPWSMASIVTPLLSKSLSSNEWRVKAAALEGLELCAKTAPNQIHLLIPKLIPVVTNQVWDTKAQVSKAARSALTSICETNQNADIKPTIPAIVNAICKPADTNKAVSELMGTTFVVPVDAPTLAILCPILSRALKEKLAIHKRAACIVISNMSKLVETPSAVAPFGSLLVPELKKVSNNVQFEEIRDEALKALSNLTKALGELYKVVEEESTREAMDVEAENAQAEAEQAKIRQEREEEAKREEEFRRKEEEERLRFKEAMDAQRELDKLQIEEERKQKEAEDLMKEKQKLSTKSASGKCKYLLVSKPV